MTVVLGVCIDHLGLASQSRAIDPPPGSPHAFEVRRVYSSLPASNVAPTQPPTIPVDRHHDEHAIGIVEHLTLDGRGSIWAVAWLNEDIDVDELRRSSYSVDARLRRPDTQWTINAVSITTSPAMTCLGRLHVIPDAHDGVGRITERQIVRLRRTDVFASSVLERAAAAARGRRRGEPLVITSQYDDVAHRSAPELGSPMSARSRRPPGGVWIHGGGHVLGVH